MSRQYPYEFSVNRWTARGGSSPRFAITCGSRVDKGRAIHAALRASELGVPFVARPSGMSLRRILEPFDLEALLVFRRRDVALANYTEITPFHEGMAYLRKLRLSDDPLVSVAGLQGGTSILDCTLGLGRDALVAIQAIGPTGWFVGVEASLPLFAFVREGLLQFREKDWPRLDIAPGEAIATLSSLPDASIDVVYLDPMFVKAQKSEAGFDLLRRFASYQRLDETWFNQARRVAARCVVVRLELKSPIIDQLDLTPWLVRETQSSSWLRIPSP